MAFFSTSGYIGFPGISKIMAPAAKLELPHLVGPGLCKWVFKNKKLLKSKKKMWKTVHLNS
jgi:hypothetical protein